MTLKTWSGQLLLAAGHVHAVILAMEIEEAIGKEIDAGIFLRFETIQEAADEIARGLDDKVQQ